MREDDALATALWSDEDGHVAASTKNLKTHMHT